jgi:hypothetical protein
MYVGQSGRRSVMLSAGGPARARVQARRGAVHGQPAPTGHVLDQLRGVDCGHPGCTEEQRTGRGSVQDRHHVGGCTQPGLGDPDHWNAEIGVRMRTRAGPTTGAQVSVAVDHQQAQPGQTVQDQPCATVGARAGRTVPAGRRYLGDHHGAFGQQVR